MRFPKKPREAVHLTALTLREFLGGEYCSQPPAQERKEDAEVKTLHTVSPCCVSQFLPRLLPRYGPLALL